MLNRQRVNLWPLCICSDDDPSAWRKVPLRILETRFPLCCPAFVIMVAQATFHNYLKLCASKFPQSLLNVTSHRPQDALEILFKTIRNPEGRYQQQPIPRIRLPRVFPR